MNLYRATVTGADDSVKHDELVFLSKAFTFAEWGILLSKRSMGSPRFPTREWMLKLQEVAKQEVLNLSGHICGRWVRDICVGNWSIADELGDILGIFQRIQLNFHAEVHVLNRETFVAGLKSISQKYPFQFIFQMDGVNNDILDVAVKAGINAVPLFDRSGGAGILPDQWPRPIAKFCGYAGGLSPDNVADQLDRIYEAVHGESSKTDVQVWIDAERRLRSEDDTKLELDKVSHYLEGAKQWKCRGYRGSR